VHYDSSLNNAWAPVEATRVHRLNAFQATSMTICGHTSHPDLFNYNTPLWESGAAVPSSQAR